MLNGTIQRVAVYVAMAAVVVGFSSGRAGAASIAISSVTNSSTCVWSNSDNGNSDEDPYNPAADSCSEPLGGSDSNFMRLSDSGTASSSASPGGSTAINFNIDTGVAVDSAVDGQDEYERGKIRYSLSFNVTALPVEDWSINLSQNARGLFGFAGDGTATAVGTQVAGNAGISTIDVDVGATDYSFTPSPSSTSQNPANNDETSVEFLGTRNDGAVVTGSGSGSFSVTIAFDIDAFSNAGCSGFICSSASGGEDAAVLMGYDNVDDCCGGTVDRIRADNYSEWGRAAGPDGYNSTWTFSVTSVCGNGIVDVLEGETCDEGANNGSSTSCCTNICQLRGGGEVCRVTAGICDVPEFCTGTSPTCPANGFASTAVVCRAASGGEVCDLQENCDGVSANCPADAVVSNGTTCRSSAGGCDVAEACDGVSKVCPADSLLSNGTVCRAAAGVCDVAESCDGVSAACPPDNFQNGTQCRAGAGVCDVAESCNGSGPDCPPDGFASGSQCRASAGVCDPAETCSGGSADCPPDALASGGVCRGPAGACDLPEFCDGNGVDCPADVLESPGVVCRAVSSGELCDVEEVCDGVTAACPSDDVQTSGVVCRSAAGLCDVAETCDGVGKICPGDAFEASGTECRAAAGACDVAETCDGVSAACPTDGFATGTECRASAGVCDVAESCDGSGPNCPVDGFDTGSVCRPDGGDCDVAETCDGSGADCPADVFEPDGTTCDDGLASTILDQCLTGTCSGTILAGNLDAFKCYKARDLKQPKFERTTVAQLEDEFGIELDAEVKKPFLHCNPADVEGASIFNADDHLVCYKVKSQKFALRPRVEVTDVFGTVQLEVKKSMLLCFPSSKTILP